MALRRDFAAHLAKHGPEPVCALLGTQGVLVLEAVDELRARVLTAAPDFNRDEFRVGDGAIQKVIEAAGTLPMMAPRRWVHLASVHKLKAKEIAPLLAYVENPSPTTVLCLSGEKVDGRTKLGQRLNKMRVMFTFEAPKQHELTAWVRQRAEGRGFVIDNDAAGLLADMIGIDIGTIDRSLDKLWTYAGAKGAIQLEHVEALVAPTRVHSIFELTDSIGDRDLANASLLLRNTIDGGAAALMVLAMISRQFRLLLKTKQVGGNNPSQVARDVGVAPFVARSLVEQARRYEESELCRALDAAARADQRLKSTRLGPGVVLDRLLVEVMEAPR